MSVCNHNHKYHEFYRHAIEGKIPGAKVLYESGYQEDVGLLRETLSPVGDLYYWMDTAQILYVSSSSADDSVTGDGARKVCIFGLDADSNEIQEIVELNGVTPVATTLSFYRVFTFGITITGDDETNVGEIALKDNTQTYELEIIPPGEGRSHSATWSVPKDYTAYLMSWHGSELSNKGVKMEFWVHSPECELWYLENIIYLLGSSTQSNLALPYKLSAYTDIEVRVSSLQSGAKLAGGFTGYCIHDSVFGAY